ncbi:ketohexokinase [Microdochium nivale]|nr:ketohexokinase [Microdochium nivale]
MQRLVAVGACYLDTILDIELSPWSLSESRLTGNIRSVPRFVHEDEKLRATNLTRRRGGNGANTAQVLQDLCMAAERKHSAKPPTRIDCSLLTVLPRRDSAAVEVIRKSLLLSHDGGAGDGVGTGCKGHVDLQDCLYREEFEEPASAYIIRSGDTGSRTIVNYSKLPDMTVPEFRVAAAELVCGKGAQDIDNNVWFHFEGRNPDVTLQYIRHLRKHHSKAGISVEIENPGRSGLQELVSEASIVFFSRAWAQDRGYKDYEECLRDQAKIAPWVNLMCCTWGQSGAAALERGPKAYEYEYEHAWTNNEPCTVDTVGAGDTFIAGMLYANMAHYQEWSLSRKLKFANELAGRKVVQEGFSGLGELMKEWL